MSASPAIGIGRNLENSNYSGISIQDYLFDPSGRGLRLTEHTLGGLLYYLLHINRHGCGILIILIHQERTSRK
jgi:hypothetical protein